jgi:hypothetical protein
MRMVWLSLVRFGFGGRNLYKRLILVMRIGGGALFHYLGRTWGYKLCVGKV